MTIQLMEQVCQTLKQANLVRGEQEFCEQWLAKSECYLRTLRFTGTEPSAEALATLSSKLGHYINELARRSDDTSQHWRGILAELRQRTQAALEVRARQRWRSVCAQKAEQRSLRA
jgi:adenylate kinase family enzyme